jgi:hypothetical protein
MTDPIRHGALPDDVEDCQRSLDTQLTLSDMLFIADGLSDRQFSLRKTFGTHDAIPRLAALDAAIRAEVAQEIKAQREVRVHTEGRAKRDADAQAKLDALLAAHPERARLKVYHWGWGGHDAMITAAKSKKEAAARVGQTPGRLWNLTITGNVHDRLTALTNPSTVFVRKDNLQDVWKAWRR